MFFNGAAIVVAITIDALVTRRLQEALRRRRAEVARRQARRGRARARGGTVRRLLAGSLVRWETLLVVAIVGVGFWSTTLSPFFLTRINLLDLITPYVFIGLLAFGLTFVVIAGEIDISVTAILAVSVVSFAQLLDHGANVWIAALSGSRSRLRSASSTGRSSALLNLPSLAVTLGTLAAYQGLAFVILSGEGVAEFPQAYLNFGGGYIRNELPVALLVLVVAAVVLGACSTPPGSAATSSRSATTARRQASRAFRRRACA